MTPHENTPRNVIEETKMTVEEYSQTRLGSAGDPLGDPLGVFWGCSAVVLGLFCWRSEGVLGMFPGCSGSVLGVFWGS